MFRSINDLRHYQVHATDGDLGLAHDFLFDQESWLVRFVVVDTRRWLGGRRVLVPPTSIMEADWSSYRLRLNMTRKQIEESPEFDQNLPVLAQEERFALNFQTPILLTGHGPMDSPVTGGIGASAVLDRETHRGSMNTATGEMRESSLRSAREVTGYHIEAVDGAIGHVDDFIVDDEAWIIRYCAIDTRNWLLSKKVLIPPAWIDRVDWDRAQVHVQLTKNEIKDSPTFDPAAPVNREYEARFYDYYGRPRYWE